MCLMIEAFVTPDKIFRVLLSLQGQLLPLLPTASASEGNECIMKRELMMPDRYRSSCLDQKKTVQHEDPVA
jgi:hypothetical protein